MALLMLRTCSKWQSFVVEGFFRGVGHSFFLFGAEGVGHVGEGIC